MYALKSLEILIKPLQNAGGEAESDQETVEDGNNEELEIDEDIYEDDDPDIQAELGDQQSEIESEGHDSNEESDGAKSNPNDSEEDCTRNNVMTARPRKRLHVQLSDLPLTVIKKRQIDNDAEATTVIYLLYHNVS